MYKVFVNDKPIILSDKVNTLSEYEVFLYKNTSIEEIVHKLQNTHCNGIYFYHHDIDILWQKFKSKFKIVNAAGGLVLNPEGQILFIRRNEHWDLPKGRMEKGEIEQETAIREVQEECSIHRLEIKTELAVTYHIYQEKNKNKLKKTFWFVMQTDDNQLPIPQEEEGITVAKFVSVENLKNYETEMYANIEELVQRYLNLIDK